MNTILLAVIALCSPVIAHSLISIANTLWKYTFNFEKKGLKEIEHNAAEWSNEDEYYYSIIQHILNNECVGKTDRENAINWFKSLKDKIQL